MLPDGPAIRAGAAIGPARAAGPTAGPASTAPYEPKKIFLLIHKFSNQEIGKNILESKDWNPSE